MKRKLLAVITVLAMCLSMIPVSSFAADTVKVTFYKNGSIAESIPVQEIAPGGKVTKPEATGIGIRADNTYPVLEWCTKDGEPWDFDNDTVGNKDIQLYAAASYAYIVFSYSLNNKNEKVYNLFCMLDGNEGFETPLGLVPYTENKDKWWIEQPAKEGDLPVLHIKEGFTFPDKINTSYITGYEGPENTIPIYGDDCYGLFITADCTIDVGNNDFDFKDKEIWVWDRINLEITGGGSLVANIDNLSRYGLKPSGTFTVDGGVNITNTYFQGLEGGSYNLNIKNGKVTASTDRNRSGICNFSNLESYLNNEKYIVKGSSKLNPTEDRDWTTNLSYYNTQLYIGDYNENVLAKTVCIEKVPEKFTYSAIGNCINAKGEDGTTASLKLTAKNLPFTGKQYTGAALSSKEWEEAGLALPTIMYKGRQGTFYSANATAPTKVGKYTAYIVVDGKYVASADFEIMTRAAYQKQMKKQAAVKNIIKTTSLIRHNITKFFFGITPLY